ncbi:MAG TPA: hypothetical protein VGN07_19680 [Steroidobacteraceae bacterium]|jgi:hypothetical protein
MARAARRCSVVLPMNQNVAAAAHTVMWENPSAYDAAVLEFLNASG